MEDGALKCVHSAGRVGVGIIDIPLSDGFDTHCRLDESKLLLKAMKLVLVQRHSIAGRIVDCLRQVFGTEWRMVNHLAEKPFTEDFIVLRE